jgi:hypothetical protein
VPIIVVHGLPTDHKYRAALEELITIDLPATVASAPELDIRSDQVTVFAPGSLVSRGHGTEIVAFIEGLYMRPERTAEVLQRLADNVRDCLLKFAQDNLPRCELIEVVPRSQRPDDGYAQWVRSTPAGS